MSAGEEPSYVEAILDRLVSFPTVAATSNLALVDWVADRLRQAGLAPVRLVGPEGDRANLFATIGDPSRPGLVLSAHLDVVAAGEPGWVGDPFRLRREGDRLIGRGTSDMKGFAAAVLAVVPALVGAAPERPVHIAFSYDEEVGCRGVPHLIARLPELCAPPAACVVGEPTGLVPVLAHKGKAAIRVSATGIPGHSARPDLGRNAIHALLPALVAARDAEARHAAEGPFDDRFAPPRATVQVGTVAGGTVLNVLPAGAVAEIEARVLPGTDPMAVLAPVAAAVAADPALALEVMAAYPALSLSGDSPLAGLVAAASGHAPGAAVSFGTEAGLYSAAGIPSAVCGPGDIGRAHRAEEYIAAGELHAAVAFVLALARDPRPL